MSGQSHDTGTRQSHDTALYLPQHAQQGRWYYPGPTGFLGGEGSSASQENPTQLGTPAKLPALQEHSAHDLELWGEEL